MYLQNLLPVFNYFFLRRITYPSCFLFHEWKKKLKEMLLTFYQLQRIIRKKERMEGRNGRFELNTLFSTALVDKTCTICWHSRANGTWQNKLRLLPFFVKVLAKKTLVFAPSTSLIHSSRPCTLYENEFKYFRDY